MAHCASLFNQLLQQFSKRDFRKLVIKHQTERNAKGFTSWSQFVSMLFCHFARADSLREISNGLACCIGKLSHLGLRKAPPKSTLAYANSNRPAELFEELFYRSLAAFRERKMLNVRKPFKFKNKLVTFDSTTITLALEAFPWAKYRSKKGGVKLHVLLDNADLMPSFVCMTVARDNDCKGLDKISLKPGTIVTLDRGYNNFAQFGEWTENGVHFVTRMKVNTKHYVLEKKIPPQNRHILWDHIIILTGERAKECPDNLRLVRAVDPKTGEIIDILTNNLELGASTISGIYRERWRIEEFFRLLKQPLKTREAASEDQDIRRNKQECSFDSNLDSSDCPAAVEVAALRLKGGMVILEPGRHVAHESVYLQGFTRMARGSIRLTADRTCPGTALSGIVSLGRLKSKIREAKFSTYRKTPEWRPGHRKLRSETLSC